MVSRCLLFELLLVNFVSDFSDVGKWFVLWSSFVVCSGGKSDELLLFL